MPRNKSETLSIRTTAEIKELVRQAADHQRRSVASMIEILIIDYAKTHLRPSPIRAERGRKPALK
jgi:uncharacterized protein (DUF1778 family)